MRWDAPSLAGKQLSGKARVMLLVRHGQYCVEASTDAQRVLTPLGRKQAAATGARLRERCLTLDAELPGVICHSTMRRAVETAVIIRDTGFGHAGLHADSGLREGAPCVPSPPWWTPSDEEVAREGPRIEAAFRAWVRRDCVGDDDAHEETGAPSEAVLTPRRCATVHAVPAAEGAATSTRVTILVCHGNVIRWFVLRALQLAPNAWLRLSVPHGSITTLTMLPEGYVTLSGLGESGHMAAHEVTA